MMRTPGQRCRTRLLISPPDDSLLVIPSKTTAVRFMFAVKSRMSYLAQHPILKWVCTNLSPCSGESDFLIRTARPRAMSQKKLSNCIYVRLSRLERIIYALEIFE